MEGSYLDKAQRTVIAQQINKTHFSLGQAKPRFTTTAQNAQKLGESQQLLGNQIQAQVYKRNVQGSSINIAGSGMQRDRVTEFQYQYGPKVAEQTQFKRKIGDLRAHNHSYGNIQLAYKTTNSDFYKQQSRSTERITNHDMLKNKATIRKHNFELGNDKQAKSSTFKQDYIPKQTTIQYIAKDIKKDFNSTHFEFGSAYSNKLSTFQIDYPLKQAQSNTKIKLGLQKSNIKLGSAQPTDTTTNQASYQYLGPSKESLNQQQLENLHKSHFILGNAQSSYSKTSQITGQYSQNPHIYQKYDKNSQIKSNFKLGIDNNKWQTVYNSNHKQRSFSVTERIRDSNSDRMSHLILGTEYRQPISTVQAAYKGRSVSTGRLNKEMLKNLRQHHFRLGIEQSQYDTTYHDYGKKGGERQGVSSVAKDIQASHFELGYSPQKLQSTMRKDYHQHQQQNRVKLRSDMLTDLRRTHFSNQKQEGIWGTEYKGKYHWIQPKIESSFKYKLGDQCNNFKHAQIKLQYCNPYTHYQLQPK